MAEVVARQFAERDITLHLASDLPLLALDRVRMQLLLRNLLDNALRQGGGGPVAPTTGHQRRGCRSAWCCRCRRCRCRHRQANPPAQRRVEPKGLNGVAAAQGRVWPCMAA